MIENKQGITNIEFEMTIQAYCPLGKELYNAEVYVSMDPNEKIMDYCHTTKFIRDLGGERFIIEDLVAEIFEHIKTNYDPKELYVSVHAETNSHFPVTVTKSL